MLVLQQIKVLPAGAIFQIYDMNKLEVTGMVSRGDKSLIFDNVRDADNYYKIYQNFYVTLLDVRYIDAYEAVFEIFTRY